MTKPLLTLATLALTAAVGCQGKTYDQQQSEAVSPDGKTAMQTRSQMRETSGGATVKETETRTREVVSSPTTMPDARMKDPAK